MRGTPVMNNLIQNFINTKILAIGDIMIDQYLFYKNKIRTA